MHSETSPNSLTAARPADGAEESGSQRNAARPSCTNRRFLDRGLRSGTAALAIVGASLALGACGGGALSASSSCQEFMSASAEEQQSATDRLATQYNKPDFASPLGSPEVPYYCSANPSVTLGDFFQRAEG